MMNSEIQVSENLKYKVIIIVNDSDISMEIAIEAGEAPDWLEVQRALLLMCLKLGSPLDEE